MQNRKKIYRLKGVVQHYAWGGDHFIAGLIREVNDNGQPYAEYWMGAHDNAPAEIFNEKETKKLNEVISSDPGLVIGNKVFNEFGRMPYLLKILDVRDMLSIQVHPDKKSAELAFKEENEKGIGLEAPNRNYKDANHKPELMVALSNFWLLHGFKPPSVLMQILSNIKELQFLRTTFETNGYHALYKTVMEMSQKQVNNTLQPLLDRIVPLYQANKLLKTNEDFWAARAAITFNRGSDIDRGIFSIYFFNLVECRPGDGVFQDAGVPHAYLEGQNVEIMANSDNVLRGGLTPKHIDVPELLKHVRFEAVHPTIIKPKRRDGLTEVYPTPARDFELSRLLLESTKETSFRTSTAEVFFLYKGEIVLSDPTDKLFLKAGDAAIGFADTKVHVRAMEDAILFRASVPHVHER